MVDRGESRMLFKQTTEIQAIIYPADTGYLIYGIFCIFKQILAFVYNHRYVILPRGVTCGAFEDFYKIIFIEIA